MIAPRIASSPLAPATPEWTLHLHTKAVSTNDLAAPLAGWHAVIADRQSGGRGRHRRAWVSDEGGLWLSAVLPTPGPAADWAILPLAAGWAVRAALADLGVFNIRLRWPNDLMAGRAKLAGILVERYRADTAVVGLGLNLTNRPETHDTALAGQTARLADLLNPPPPRAVVLDAILTRLAHAQHLIADRSAADFLPALNTAWTGARVAIDLDGRAAPLVGRLTAVDAAGRLQLDADDGVRHHLSPLQVARLREVF
ncbi:MAG: biotin--[acetyl-CoA-carboxylase] ligase [Verrucomicrobiota bacterium]